MDQIKKLAQVASSITPVEETQFGQLTGGFAAFSSAAATVSRGSNTNNATSCSCTTNTNNATSCSCSTKTTIG